MGSVDDRMPVGSVCGYCGGPLDPPRCPRCAPLLDDVHTIEDYQRFVRDARRASDR